MFRARISPVAAALSAVLPLVLLIPFANRAYHIDDPLYLWAAKQIHRNPLDYYGAVVNEWGYEQPLSEVMVNPPGHPFFLAGVAWVFGWGEVPLHVAVALTASLLGLGTYLLAGRMCTNPGLAAGLAIFTPAFLVSSATVMTDIPMTALFVWSVYLWTVGTDTNRHACYFASAVCASLALLFKYTGVTVVPLLFVYSLMATRRVGLWSLHLLLPLAALFGYQAVEYVVYGKAQLFYSFEYVQSDYGKGFVAPWLKPGVSAIFLGGSLASIALLAPVIWSWRVLAAAGPLILGLTVLVFSRSDTLLYTTRVSPGVTWLLSAQYAFWLVAGALMLAIPVLDVLRRRDRDSVLLFLWVAGAFAFVVVVNWSINARSLLPLLVPMAILAARRVEDADRASLVPRPWLTWGAVGVSAVLSLTLTFADSLQANIARDAAAKFVRDDADYPYRYFFESHWGFQYYMEEAGVPYFDDTETDVHDRIVAPVWSSVDVAYNPALARRVPALEVKRHGLRWVTTMHPALCAGFYAHTRGPLPFAFGPVPPEEFAVYQVEYYE